ncbi:MAG: YbaK/EbsC family protein [Chloroflexota bacterium]
MRYSQLGIQTQRSAPSEFRTAGRAYLYRAGYISRSGEPLSLAELAFEKMSSLLAQSDQKLSALFQTLGISSTQITGSRDYYVLYKDAVINMLVCPQCGYSAVRDMAAWDRPSFSNEAIGDLEKVFTPECNTIAQLAQFLNIPQQKTAKALMYTRLSDNEFIFVVIRGDHQLSEAKLKAAVGECRLASQDEILNAGAIPGYASPIGLKKGLVAVDELIMRSPNLAAGANEAGYHLLNTNIPRDYQPDLVYDLVMANAGDACLACKTALQAISGEFAGTENEINWQSILIALSEVHHDEKGLLLPIAGSPFFVYLLALPGKTLDTKAAAEEIYQQLTSLHFNVLFDDREERAGVKFADADLIGCPVRITIGERSLLEGMVEVKLRNSSESQQIAVEKIIEFVKQIS